MGNSSLIAPCGMNCGVCMAYLRVKNHCPGCSGSDKSKAKHCVNCRIKNCKNLKSSFCFSCDVFPCERINHLDKRYRTKYNMSMIENLENIKKLGLKKFVSNEKKRWTCPKCGGVICVHRGCINCGDWKP